MAKRIEKGDLVRVKDDTWNLAGLVTGTDKDNYVIDGHLDVCNCIVPIGSCKMLKKQALAKKYHKYMNDN